MGEQPANRKPVHRIAFCVLLDSKDMEPQEDLAHIIFSNLRLSHPDVER